MSRKKPRQKKKIKPTPPQTFLDSIVKKGGPRYVCLHKLAPAATVKQAAWGERVLVFEVSNSTPDRDGDILPVAQWDLTDYKKNPQVLWAHDHSALPVGKCVKLWVEGKSLMAAIEFAEHDFAQTVFQLCKQGYLSATSVGYKPSTRTPNEFGGYTYGPMELLEISIVPIPANANALIQARAAGIDTALVAKYFDSAKEEDMNTIVLDLVEVTKGKTECARGKACPLEPNQWAGDCPARRECPFRAGTAIASPTLHRPLGWPAGQLAQAEHPRTDGSAPAGGASATPPGWNDGILRPSDAPKGYQSYAQAMARCKTDAQRRRLTEQHEAYNRMR